jgi:hypothetical protein
VGTKRSLARRLPDLSTTFRDPTFLEAWRIHIQVVRCDGRLARFSALRGKISAKPLSRQTPCQSMPIATTALPFIVRVGPGGAMELRIAM